MSIDPKIRRRHTFLFEFDDANSIDQFYFSDDGPSLRVEQFSGKRHDRITVPLEAQDEKVCR